MNSSVYKTFDEAEMLSLGKTIAHKLQTGDVVYLQGQLGAGKTTLERDTTGAWL